MTRPTKPTPKDLLQTSVLSSASFSEITACFAGLSRQLRNDFEPSFNGSARQLEDSAKMFSEAAKHSEAVSKFCAEQLSTAQRLQDHGNATLDELRPNLTAVATALDRFSTVLATLKPLLEASVHLYEAEAEQRSRYFQNLETMTARMAVLENSVSKADEQYRRLCSALQRLDDSGN